MSGLMLVYVLGCKYRPTARDLLVFAPVYDAYVLLGLYLVDGVEMTDAQVRFALLYHSWRSLNVRMSSSSSFQSISVLYI